MLVEITDFLDKEVFTNRAKRLGTVTEVIIDNESNKVHELLLEDTNEELVENSVALGVPFRWIQCNGEIIILRYFPGKIRMKEVQRRSDKKPKQRVVKTHFTEEGHDAGRIWR